MLSIHQFHYSSIRLACGVLTVQKGNRLGLDERVVLPSPSHPGPVPPEIYGEIRQIVGIWIWKHGNLENINAWLFPLVLGGTWSLGLLLGGSWPPWRSLGGPDSENVGFSLVLQGSGGPARAATPPTGERAGAVEGVRGRHKSFPQRTWIRISAS